MDLLRQGAQELSQGFGQAGRMITQAVGESVREFATWESSFAGVRKTVEGTDQQLAALEEGLKQMALTEVPIDVNELAGVAEAAGQLGIQTENVLDFTETMAKLGVTTNLSADEAATALARFANLQNVSADQYENLGSVIVELGNNMATTEAEIVSMAVRLAGAGETVGLSEEKVLGFAAALSSVGIRAELGGTNFQKFMLEINSAVKAGGDQLDDFAAVAGVSAESFADQWEADPAVAMQMFFKGLDGIRLSGEDVVPVLENLGLTGSEMGRVMLAAATASEMFGEATAMASRAWEENLALSAEAAIRFGTMESLFQFLRTGVTLLKVAIGEALAPVIRNIVPIFQNVVAAVTEWIENNPRLTQLLAAMGPILIGIGAALGFVATMLAVVSASGAPIFAIAAALAAVGLAAAALVVYWDEITGAIRTAIGWVRDFVSAFFEAPVGQVLSRIVPVLALIRLIRDNWEGIRGVIANVADFLSSAFRAAVDGVAAAVDWVRSNWESIARVLRTIAIVALAPLILTITGISAAVRWIRENWEAVLGVLQTVANFLFGPIVAAVEAVREAVGWVRENWDGIRAVLADIVNVVLAPFRAVIAAMVDHVAQFIDQWDLLMDAIEPIVMFVRDIFGTVFDWLEDKFVGIVNTIIDLANKVPGVNIPRIGEEPEGEGEHGTAGQRTTGQAQAYFFGTGEPEGKEPETEAEPPTFEERIDAARQRREERRAERQAARDARDAGEPTEPEPILVPEAAVPVAGTAEGDTIDAVTATGEPVTLRRIPELQIDTALIDRIVLGQAPVPVDELIDTSSPVAAEFEAAGELTAPEVTPAEVEVLSGEAPPIEAEDVAASAAAEVEAALNVAPLLEGVDAVRDAFLGMLDEVGLRIAAIPPVEVGGVAPAPITLPAPETEPAEAVEAALDVAPLLDGIGMVRSSFLEMLDAAGLRIAELNVAELGIPQEPPVLPAGGAPGAEVVYPEGGAAEGAGFAPEPFPEWGPPEFVVPEAETVVVQEAGVPPPEVIAAGTPGVQLPAPGAEGEQATAFDVPDAPGTEQATIGTTNVNTREGDTYQITVPVTVEGGTKASGQELADAFGAQLETVLRRITTPEKVNG